MRKIQITEENSSYRRRIRCSYPYDLVSCEDQTLHGKQSYLQTSEVMLNLSEKLIWLNTRLTDIRGHTNTLGEVGFLIHRAI